MFHWSSYQQLRMSLLECIRLKKGNSKLARFFKPDMACAFFKTLDFIRHSQLFWCMIKEKWNECMIFAESNVHVKTNGSFRNICVWLIATKSWEFSFNKIILFTIYLRHRYRNISQKVSWSFVLCLVKQVTYYNAEIVWILHQSLTRHHAAITKCKIDSPLPKSSFYHNITIGTSYTTIHTYSTECYMAI